jgi:hypothetical protein
MPSDKAELYLVRPKNGVAPAKLCALYEYLIGWFGAKLADPA